MIKEWDHSSQNIQEVVQNLDNIRDEIYDYIELDINRENANLQEIIEIRANFESSIQQLAAFRYETRDSRNDLIMGVIRNNFDYIKNSQLRNYRFWSTVNSY